jgi:hypothetical protein
MATIAGPRSPRPRSTRTLVDVSSSRGNIPLRPTLRNRYSINSPRAPSLLREVSFADSMGKDQGIEVTKEVCSALRYHRIFLTDLFLRVRCRPPATRSCHRLQVRQDHQVLTVLSCQLSVRVRLLRLLSGSHPSMRL